MTKAAIKAPESYPTPDNERLHSRFLWNKYKKKIMTFNQNERTGIERVTHCVSMVKHCKPEEAHAKLEHYLKWLVDDNGGVLDTGKKE